MLPVYVTTMILLALGTFLLCMAVAVVLGWFALRALLQPLWQSTSLLPNAAPLFRAAATGMHAASELAGRAGQVACVAGQSVRTGGATLEQIKIPEVKLNHQSLWEALKKLPFPGWPEAITAAQNTTGLLPDVSVMKLPTIELKSVFGAGQNPITKTGENLMSAASFLGYTCQPGTNALGAPAEPPPPDTVARAFDDAGKALNSVADLLEE